MNNILRVGVVCEGPTDYYAITHFIGAALASAGVTVKFLDLQPEMDKTQIDGGWSLIEKWFKQYNPDIRIRRYLGGGLFDGNLDAKACDLFFIQMDSDILDHLPFLENMENNYGLKFVDIENPLKRGSAVVNILKKWSNIESCSNNDKKKHVFAPAVDSTETWCIASFKRFDINLEELKGESLGSKFMEILHESEGRAMQHFSQVDKDKNRREKFCKKHSKGFERAKQQCWHLNKAINDLVEFGKDS